MNKSENPRRALGKGLNSLLPSRNSETGKPDRPDSRSDNRPDNPEAGRPEAGWKAVVTDLDIDQIRANPSQPRRQFHDQKIEELAASIRNDGIIQPLIVRRAGQEFQLVAGERRWRAARIAGLKRVPVVVREIPDDKMLEIAVVENIQREDLNPIELAEAFQSLSRELHLNHEQIGQRTGKDRATITNYLRLLHLSDAVREMVAEKKLSPGHARALLQINDPFQQKDLAERAIHFGWSVRKIESIVSPDKPPAEKRERKADPNVKAAIEELEKRLGTRVRILEKRGGQGEIHIEYYSAEDLDRIYETITHIPE